MPTNKHAIIRYRTIDRSLRNIDRQWTWRELAEACAIEIASSTGKQVNVSERTIKYDIAAMRTNDVLGYYAPIEYDRKEKTYYYSNPKYTLTESPINKSDTEVLHNAVSLIQQFMEINEATGIQNILTKLESSVDRQEKRFDPIIKFDNPSDSGGHKWLYQLYQLIKKRATASIRYHPFGKVAKNRIISPHLLKEYKGRWYLLAYDHSQKDSRVFALDRMRSISSSISPYTELDKDISKRYFEHVVGVSVYRDRKVETVRFEVYDLQIQYLKTKPVHNSQRVIDESENKAIFEIDVIVNYELISEFLSYQTTVKVVSPQSLVDELRDRITQLTLYYNK